MNKYVVFLEKKTFQYVTISILSPDYDDHLRMEEYFEQKYRGSRQDCNNWLTEKTAA